MGGGGPFQNPGTSKYFEFANQTQKLKGEPQSAFLNMENRQKVIAMASNVQDSPQQKKGKFQKMLNTASGGETVNTGRTSNHNAGGNPNTNTNNNNGHAKTLRVARSIEV